MAIQLKRSLTPDIDPAYILMQGQIAIEMPNTSNSSDTPFKLKIGDGIHSWSDLPYFGGDIPEIDVPQPSSTPGLAAGAAAIGSSLLYARADHVHPLQTSVSGNAGTATKLQSPITITLSGDVSGTVTSDMGSPITIPVSVVGGGISVSETQPTDTKLVWIDTSIGGVLKYYNGSSWVPTKAVWG